MERRLDLLGECIEFLVIHGTSFPDIAHNGTFVTDGLNDVARAGLALRSDESRSFRYTTQCLTEVPGAADEWHLEVVLVDVMLLVRWSQHLGFVDVVDADGLQDL